jgi:hypothetical protein
MAYDQGRDGALAAALGHGAAGSGAEFVRRLGRQATRGLSVEYPPDLGMGWNALDRASGYRPEFPAGHVHGGGHGSEIGACFLVAINLAIPGSPRSKGIDSRRRCPRNPRRSPAGKFFPGGRARRESISSRANGPATRRGRIGSSDRAVRRSSRGGVELLAAVSRDGSGRRRATGSARSSPGLFFRRTE